MREKFIKNRIFDLLLIMVILSVNSGCSNLEPEPTSDVHAAQLPPTWTKSPDLPSPTSTSSPTSSPEPTAFVESEVPFKRFVMLDTMDGWACGLIDRQVHLWRTNDGGMTWIDASPQTMKLPASFSYSFLDSQHAWAQVDGLPNRRYGLAYTSDGGETWTLINNMLLLNHSHRFQLFNESEGILRSYDYSQRKNKYYTIHETQDGGTTWEPVKLATYPEGIRFSYEGKLIFSAGSFGESLLIDSNRLIFIKGNFLDKEPAESIPLLITTDRGLSWSTMDLPFPPGEFQQSWANAQSPVFHNDSNGTLSINLSIEEDYRHAFAFYKTTDGGLNWTFQSLVENISHSSGRVEFITELDIILRCGDNLCVSRDGALTWQTIASNLVFDDIDASTYVASFDFVDVTTGWALVGRGGFASHQELSLWRTIDGGDSWQEMEPSVNIKDLSSLDSSP